MIDSPLREDYSFDLPGLHVGAQKLTLLGEELYLWAEVSADISHSTLRLARRILEQVHGKELVINVDSRDPRAVRFAEFFGFTLVDQSDHILIMEKR